MAVKYIVMRGMIRKFLSFFLLSQSHKRMDRELSQVWDLHMLNRRRHNLDVMYCHSNMTALLKYLFIDQGSCLCCFPSTICRI